MNRLMDFCASITAVLLGAGLLVTAITAFPRISAAVGLLIVLALAVVPLERAVFFILARPRLKRAVQRLLAVAWPLCLVWLYPHWPLTAAALATITALCALGLWAERRGL